MEIFLFLFFLNIDRNGGFVMGNPFRALKRKTGSPRHVSSNYGCNFLDTVRPLYEVGWAL